MPSSSLVEIEVEVDVEVGVEVDIGVEVGVGVEVGIWVEVEAAFTCGWVGGVEKSRPELTSAKFS